MSIQQFINTLTQINSCQHVNKSKAYYKHLFWQIRKIFNLFPFEIQISNSKIIARNKYCGICALVNCIGLYDYNIMNLLKLLSQGEKIFFDIGANIGLYSLLVSESDTIKTVAFEPHPETFLQLEENVKLNERKIIILQKIALSDVNGKSNFTNLSESSLNRLTTEQSKDSIEISTKRADKVCNELNMVPSIVKIDVEGFELNVLLGFGSILSAIKLIILEWTESNKNDKRKIIQLLENNAFIGPFYFNFDEKYFIRQSRNYEENVVFVSKKYTDELCEKYLLKFL